MFTYAFAASSQLEGKCHMLLFEYEITNNKNSRPFEFLDPCERADQIFLIKKTDDKSLRNYSL